MNSKIPILDLTSEIDELWDELNAAIHGVLRSGQFIMGEAVQQFEKEFANYLGVKHAIAVNSGTDALLIALRALGIGPGDEVITTSFTFFATAEVISLIGASPVFVDIDPRTFNIDVSLIEKKISSRTKAIIPVHLYGYPVDMRVIQDIAHRHNLRIVEDVAQATGANFCEQKLGTIGDLGAFSFFPTKNLGAYGDAGMLVTNDSSMAEMASMLRTHGSKKKYQNEIVGYNSRMDTLQAAILRVKLPHVDEWNAKRREVARYYNKILASVPNVVVPVDDFETDGFHVFHQYTIRVLNGKRDAVQKSLKDAGIDTMIYYPTPVHKLPIYQHMNIDLAETEKASREVLSLPIWPSINHEQLDTIGRIVKDTIAW